MKYNGKSGHENVLKRLGSDWTVEILGKRGGLAEFSNGEYKFIGGYGNTGYYVESLKQIGSSFYQDLTAKDFHLSEEDFEEKKIEWVDYGDDSEIYNFFEEEDEDED